MITVPWGIDAIRTTVGGSAGSPVAGTVAQMRPLYESVVDRIGAGHGTELLDAGCGAGLASQIAAQRGAVVSGFDATAELLEIARERVPNGEFVLGDLASLPYPEDTFDGVVGFNSFQYAARPREALEEARRVARPGAPVVMPRGRAPSAPRRPSTSPRSGR